MFGMSEFSTAIWIIWILGSLIFIKTEEGSTGPQMLLSLVTVFVVGTSMILQDFHLLCWAVIFEAVRPLVGPSWWWYQSGYRDRSGLLFKTIIQAIASFAAYGGVYWGTSMLPNLLN